jgi:hypothetical protein
MRSRLELRSPSDGTGWASTWTFTGRDEGALRDCLAHLDRYATDVPWEGWDAKKHKGVVRAKDRWQAAMLLYALDGGPLIAEKAWTAEGALALTEMLPPNLDDLKADIHARFGD